MTRIYDTQLDKNPAMVAGAAPAASMIEGMAKLGFDIAHVSGLAKPDPKWGETPVAFLELKPDSNTTAEELTAHCRGLLAGYQVPREIRFDAIPKTSAGKIQKFMLREQAKSASAVD